MLNSIYNPIIIDSSAGWNLLFTTPNLSFPRRREPPYPQNANRHPIAIGSHAGWNTQSLKKDIRLKPLAILKFHQRQNNYTRFFNLRKQYNQSVIKYRLFPLDRFRNRCKNVPAEDQGNSHGKLHSVRQYFYSVPQQSCVL
jgi:hypothetical protein